MSDNKYYVRFRGRTLGPFDENKVRELVKRGQVTRMHELSPDGVSWQQAEAFQELFPSSMRQESVIQQNAPLESASTAPVVPASGPAEWYAHLDDENKGPVTKDQLMQWVASDEITPETLVWKEGTENWAPASTAIPECFSIQTDSGPNFNAAHQMELQQTVSKSCPFCTQMISSAAVKCPHCQSMLNNFCSNCGSQCATNQAVCLKCGTALANTHEAIVIAQPVQATGEASPHAVNIQASASQQTAPQSSGLTTTSFVLSGIGLFFFGIILCPIALVLAIVALSKDEKNAVAALIVSIVTFIISIFFFLYVLGNL